MRTTTYAGSWPATRTPGGTRVSTLSDSDLYSKVRHLYLLNNLTALYVLPSFESFGDGSGVVTSFEYAPQTKKELMVMLEKGKVVAFHMEYNPKGQNATNYERWYACENETETYPIEYQWMYEPYVVGSRLAIHLFDPRLRGFGECFSCFCFGHLTHFSQYCTAHVNKPNFLGGPHVGGLKGFNKVSWVSSSGCCFLFTPSLSRATL